MSPRDSKFSLIGIHTNEKQTDYNSLLYSGLNEPSDILAVTFILYLQRVATVAAAQPKLHTASAL